CRWSRKDSSDHGTGAARDLRSSAWHDRRREEGRRSHLLLGPRHVLHMQSQATVHGFTRRRLLPKDMVVLHAVVTAQIVGRHAAIDVMRGIDVQPALEYMRGRIGCVDMR